LVRADDNRDLILIAGASPLARWMARELAASEPVCLIDNNANLCQAATSEGLHAIKGNVLNEDLLDVAGVMNARSFIAMTTNHEVNRVAAQHARTLFGVPLVWAWPAAAATSPVSPGETLPGDVPLLSPAARWNEWIMRKEVERVAVPVEQRTGIPDLAAWIAKLGFLPLVIERKGRRFPAVVVTEIEPGDTVTGLRRLPVHEQPPDIFEELMRHCPFIDLPGRPDATEVFAAAADALAPLVGLDAATIRSLLDRREQESSTVVAPGVAIPHVIIDGDQPIALLTARCREGAVFPGATNQPVEFIFVIIGARSARNLHLRVLSAIAQLFQDPAFEDIMLAAPDTESMRKIILGTRRRRF
jgi:mannitol/fructose-specific phosphotransferase system IIA component (Ntr-type)